MNRKFEEALFCFCACTLKGIKPGSIFSCQKKTYPDLYDNIQYYKDLLAIFNLELEILKDDERYVLLYLYRPTHLEIIWKQKKCQNFLIERGYTNNIKTNIQLLTEKLKSDEFPHDIGVFLGYNIDDVISFIENNGQNYEAVGHWKVYYDKEAKEKIFSMFNDCTNTYLEQFYSGYSLFQLI